MIKKISILTITLFSLYSHALSQSEEDVITAYENYEKRAFGYKVLSDDPTKKFLAIALLGVTVNKKTISSPTAIVAVDYFVNDRFGLHANTSAILISPPGDFGSTYTETSIENLYNFEAGFSFTLLSLSQTHQYPLTLGSRRLDSQTLVDYYMLIPTNYKNLISLRGGINYKTINYIEKNTLESYLPPKVVDINSPLIYLGLSTTFFMNLLIEITDDDLKNRFGAHRSTKMLQIIYADLIMNTKEANTNGLGWRLGLKDGSSMLGILIEGGFCPIERYNFRIGFGYAFSR